MEKTFDEWNEQLRTYLAEKQEKLAVNFQARKLQEYRESVSELQVRAHMRATSPVIRTCSLTDRQVLNWPV